MSTLPEAIAKRRAEIWGPNPFPYGKSISDCLPELFCQGRIQHVQFSSESSSEPGEALLEAIECAVERIPSGAGGRLDVEKIDGELVGFLTVPSGFVEQSTKATSVPYAQDVVIRIQANERVAG